MAKFPFYFQLDAMDCGPSGLRMVAKYYGKNFSIQGLREKCNITKDGVSLLGISDAATAIGFVAKGVKLSLDELEQGAPLPCIVHWKHNHFVVVYKISKKLIYVADPAQGLLKYSKTEFLEAWHGGNSSSAGLCLLLEPTSSFYAHADEKLKQHPFAFLLSYVKPFRTEIVKLFFALLIGSIMMLLFPFLTQAIVDRGIELGDLKFITLVLLAQILLIASMAVVEVVRSWILLKVSMNVNISLISDFLLKLMKLPLGFFDSKLTGDLLQRIGDQSRIENFLTTSTLNVMFSFLNVIVFGAVLLVYSWQIFALFFLGALLYLLWISIFMKSRRKLDHLRFEQYGKNQNKLIEIIKGIQEVKLNNCEDLKRNEWQAIQMKLFQLNSKSLALGLKQDQGAAFILRMIGILTTFLAARYVVLGNITLGAMLAVTYIVGQLNAPIDQLLFFLQTAQDAKLSLERLGEVYEKESEEVEGDDKLQVLPNNKSIELKGVSFQYEGIRSPYVLRDVNLIIEESKTTAIVGVSGSGKTTLMKLLLGFFEPVKGEVNVGGRRLNLYSGSFWRSRCGVVLQDGYIFSDSIKNNIAVSDPKINQNKLMVAAKMSCLDEYIEALPMGYETLIGDEGAGLSQGQRQRLLIARAIYKQPEYLFFDEATNSLDAKNEKKVVENINKFAKGRTVLVIAHRLSTVRNADRIIVLDEGRVVEQGNHNDLITLKGKYYELIKEQLELGN